MDKKAMRRAGLEARRSLTAQERLAKSQDISEAVCQSRAFQQAKAVFCYVSSPDEVHTAAILTVVLEEGKTLAVPYITDAGAGRMEAARLEALEDLVTGVYDIPTVPERDKDFLKPEDIDVIIVPGSAFDPEGRRIGMGGGFYDRFLERSSAAKLALAYDCQVFERLPAEKYDKKVDYIFTESQIYMREDLR